MHLCMHEGLILAVGRQNRSKRVYKHAASGLNNLATLLSNYICERHSAIQTANVMPVCT